MTNTGAYGSGRPVYLVDGNRTPFLKARGVPGPFRASDLAVAAGRTVVDLFVPANRRTGAVDHRIENPPRLLRLAEPQVPQGHLRAQVRPNALRVTQVAVQTGQAIGL